MKFLKPKILHKEERRNKGRYGLIKKLINAEQKTLNIGCKYSRHGNINLDIDYTVGPDVVADVCNLPIKNGSFAKVIFSEVIEHLPEGKVSKALNEISRVLVKHGELILTTPNDYWFYTLTDPAYLLYGHRHYKKDQIMKLVEENNFEVKKCMVRGGFWCFVFMMWYYFLTYTIGVKIPTILVEKETNDYFKDNSKGFTIFLVASNQRSSS